MEIFPNWTVIPVVTFLLIFLFILKKIFFTPLAATLEARHRRIEGAQKEAEDIRKASQDRLSDVDRRMREARRESDAHMAQLRNQALGEKTRMITERRGETDKLLSDARQEIRKKTESASETLKSQSAEFARQIAARILKRPVSGGKATQA